MPETIEISCPICKTPVKLKIYGVTICLSCKSRLWIESIVHDDITISAQKVDLAFNAAKRMFQ